MSRIRCIAPPIASVNGIFREGFAGEGVGCINGASLRLCHTLCARSIPRHVHYPFLTIATTVDWNPASLPLITRLITHRHSTLNHQRY